MDKIEKLKLFCLIAQKKSFSQAALTLNLPRSTVTHAIKSLEKEYEVLLFYRSTRNVSLTHEGSIFYLEAANVIRQLKELNRVKVNKNHQHGEISIGLPLRLATQLLIPSLYEYYAMYPQVKILVNSQDAYSDLIETGLDCVIRVGSVQTDSLIAREIGYSALITLASKPYIHQYGLPDVAKLERHKAVAYLTDKKMHNCIQLAFEQDCYAVGYAIMVEDTESYISAGLAGLGMIQIPEFDANQVLETGQMQVLFPNIKPASLAVNILITDRKYRPQYLNDFLDWLEKKMKEHLRSQAKPFVDRRLR
ncbi:LysR substrate-binding domain-containing protein [Acinetobacter sp. KS-LM10]|uniref:LysR substrate-binding domain-containing protein n=1 Tax=Acinetobacter sp. KS-LM10 TaxID=3120518 RepID=UPI0030D39782